MAKPAAKSAAKPRSKPTAASTVPAGAEAVDRNRPGSSDRRKLAAAVELESQASPPARRRQGAPGVAEIRARHAHRLARGRGAGRDGSGAGPGRDSRSRAAR